MSDPAKKLPPKKRQPPVYTVEVEDAPEDPRAAERVRAWLLARVTDVQR